MAKLDDYLTENRNRFEELLCELLRIASVSAKSDHADEVRKAGNWVFDQFKAMNFQTEMIETAGHPIVYAESITSDTAPTVLVYGHYDVQPPEPLDQWHSPPFEPTRRDGNIVARGATDDKGQMLTHIFSTAALLACEGSLPINLKFLIEGEEEVGSENLEKFIHENKQRLKCDCIVISDTSQFAPGQPAITYGLRGIDYYELKLTGPKQDLHSGSFGGGVTNPANTLSKIMASLIDEQGRITIDGFYDEVVALTDRERDEFAKLPFDESKFMQQLGVEGLSGEEGYSTLERRWARPTFDINGMTSGYQGEGAKTILPACASAKFSFRLVPNQDPKKIATALEQKIKQSLPPGIKSQLISYHGAPGVVVSLDSPYVSAALRAIEQGFGTKPVFIREGGSIPVVSTFKDILGIDTLLLGWGLDDDNTHSPNEKFNLEDFHHGIKSSAYLWKEIAKIKHATVIKI